ncbi:MAG: type II toxin-antitoxin system VapC family toxin, partial [Promethearchaeota archaeon]
TRGPRGKEGGGGDFGFPFRTAVGRGIMGVILAETTVVIDLWRGRSDVRERLERVGGEQLCISGMTVLELYDGLGYTRQKHGEDIFRKVVRQHERILGEFDVLPVTETILQRAGLKRGELRAKGISVDVADCIIGVTAEIAGASRILTRNPKHLTFFGIPVDDYGA